jgi:hypothetical protein
MPLVPFVRAGLGQAPFVMFLNMTEPELRPRIEMQEFSGAAVKSIVFDLGSLELYGGHRGRPIYVEHGFTVEWNTLSEHIRLGDELRSALAEQPNPWLSTQTRGIGVDWSYLEEDMRRAGLLGEPPKPAVQIVEPVKSAWQRLMSFDD